MRNQLPRTTIVGNLTADPQIFGEKTDTPRAVFTIAVNYGWDREEEEFRYNAFYQITYFGDSGINFANSFSKGDRVFALCALGNHTKVAYDYDEDEEEVTEFNQTLLTLNADVAGPSTEFNEVEIVEDESKKPKKKAAKAKRSAPKDEDEGEEEDVDETEEDEDEDEEEEEEEAPKPKKKTSSTTKRSTASSRKAPPRRGAARRPKG